MPFADLFMSSANPALAIVLAVLALIMAMFFRKIPVEIEGINPKPADLVQLIQHANALKIKIIFVQPQFSTKTAKFVAKEINGQVVFANPLAEDWMENLVEVANKFKMALR